MGAFPQGSEQELEQFKRIQKRLKPLCKEVLSDPRHPRTVVVVPSMTLDREVLSRISGVHHYEERMLCLLMLLQYPRTEIVFVSSTPIDQYIVDYFLNCLPSVPVNHARERLTLLDCHDSSPVSLVEKILDRPRLIMRIQQHVISPQHAHLTCFTATEKERSLATKLGIPLYACDPDLSFLGTKEGSRKIMREAGLLVSPGFEDDIKDKKSVVSSLTKLKDEYPTLKKAVVKLNEGFSGEGNATFTYNDAPSGDKLEPWIDTHLEKNLKFEAKDENLDHFMEKLGEMEGIVEAFIEGDVISSPSVQCLIDPLGKVEVVSTHDQILGGPTGQVFLGCQFPAHEVYRLELQEMGHSVAEKLKERGVVGRFAIDFLSRKEQDEKGSDFWKHYGIEINLRMGGTTHPFMMLQYLTDGFYDYETGLYRTRGGEPRFYVASDTVQRDVFRGLSPKDLTDIVVLNNLHFRGSTQEGVVFHLIGALSEFGKVGMVCIGRSREHAKELFDNTREILVREASIY